MLQEFIKFRTEIGRELLNIEVDSNFRFVSNPWSTDRTYTEGMVVYHEVPVDPVSGGTSTIGTTGTTLVWFRANTSTTQGLFLIQEWDVIGGTGGANLSSSLNYFDNIVVNTTSIGSYSSSNDATILPFGNDALQFASGDGILLDHDVVQNIIRINTDLTINYDSGTGDLTVQGNTVNIGSSTSPWTRDATFGRIYPNVLTDKVAIGTNNPLGYFHVRTPLNTGLAAAIIVTNPDRVLIVDDSAKFHFGTGLATRYREIAYGSTKFAVYGDSQSCKLTTKTNTETASYKEVFLDDISEVISMPGQLNFIGFKITVVAVQTNLTRSGMMRIYRGAIKNNGGSVTLVGTITTEIIAADTATATWEVEITAEDVSDYLKIRVRGDGSKIRWVFDIELIETKIT